MVVVGHNPAAVAVVLLPGVMDQMGATEGLTTVWSALESLTQQSLPSCPKHVVQDQV